MDIRDVKVGKTYKTSIKGQEVVIRRVNRKSKTALATVVKGFLIGRDRACMAEDIIEEVKE